MLTSLDILNGEMSLKFDSLNNIYTVDVAKDVSFLDLNYTYTDGYEISIYGNDLKDKKNEVVISVYNDNEVNSYYLYVYKDSDAVSNFTLNEETLEVKDYSILYQYAAPGIGSICFIFILLFFTLLFKKTKKVKH